MLCAVQVCHCAVGHGLFQGVQATYVQTFRSKRLRCGQGLACRIHAGSNLLSRPQSLSAKNAQRAANQHSFKPLWVHLDLVYTAAAVGLQKAMQHSKLAMKWLTCLGQCAIPSPGPLK